jgi:hypothetical protein
MDAVKTWQAQSALDMENTVGSKYAKFCVYAVEGATPNINLTATAKSAVDRQTIAPRFRAF